MKVADRAKLVAFEAEVVKGFKQDMSAWLDEHFVYLQEICDKHGREYREATDILKAKVKAIK
jgi:hypothetical protein